MPVSTAPRTGITRWSAEADPFNRTQTDADHALLDDLVAIDLHDGTLAARPAVGIRGRYFTESAASAGLPGTTWREDGTAWRSLGSRVLSTGTTDVAKVVAGVTGQTANLQEWRAGASTLGHIDSAGQLFAVGAQLGLAPQTALAAMLGVTPTSAAAVAAIIRGAVSQSADLQQWQSNAGTVLARVDSTGAGTFAGVTTAGTVTGRLARWSSAAVGDIPLQITGFAGQTGDLTQWRDSTGTVKSSISASGIYNVQGIAYIGDTAQTTTTLLRAGVASNIAIAVQGAASQTGDLTRWTDSGGASLVSVAGTGRLNANAGAVITNSLNTTQTALFVQNAGAVGTTTSAFRRALGQTANIMEWQDNGGGVLGFVSPVGDTQLPFLSVGGTRLASVLASFLSNATGTVPVVAQGIAGQTASLQEWRSSAGVVNASVAADGSVFSRGSVTAQWTLHGNATRYGAGSSAIMSVNTGAAGNEGAIVRGVASQTADLQQWQDSTAAAVARITSSGSLVIAGASPRSAIGSAGPLSLTAFGVSPGPGESGVMPLGVRGVASQSADLQQWQSSAGTPLASMKSGGQLVLGGTTPSTAATQLTVVPTGVGSPGIAVQTVSGQTAVPFGVTAPSSITIIAQVTPSGNVQGTGAYTTLSDASVKRNIRSLPHDSALDVIKRLRPQLFDYIDGERDQVGFVAQDVAQHLPHAVVPFSSTGRSWDYDRLGVRSEAIVAYLVRAVQELAAAA